jgi:chorismate mutase/prephenate dehydratase
VQVVADCDEAIVLLLQERAKAQQMIFGLQGPGTGPMSAELTLEELNRIECANAPEEDAPPPVLGDQAVRSVFQEIARVCSQLRCTVAYLGPPATFTHQASRSRFGTNADYVQCDRIPDVFTAVERGQVEWGVAPVENSTEGAISQTLDLLATTELQVVAEVCLDIRHNLLSHAEIHNVQKVFSHPQALAQSRGWLQTHCPGAQIVSESSTARSAELASQAKPEEGVAAVASLLAGNVHVKNPHNI